MLSLLVFFPLFLECFATTQNSLLPHCPENNDEELIYSPDNLDVFWVCKNGQRETVNCLNAPHDYQLVCDFIKKIGHKKSKRSVKQQNVLSHSEKLKKMPFSMLQEATKHFQEQMAKFKPEPRCPKLNKDFATLIPHETECSKYYICESGIAIERHCPDDLHFNPRLRVCDFPETAKCEKEKDLSGKQKQISNLVLTKTEKGTQSPGVPSPFCPVINGVNPIFFRHPLNCSIYYICGNGLAYEQHCPAGLHFNVKQKVCDFPNRAGCYQDKNVRSKLGDKNPKCPEKNRGVATLIPHETDCTKYYICESGKAIERYCPDDLHFNARLKVCDFQDKADCQLGKEDEDY